ncbi:MAG: CRISPR-associated protein [Isoptericola variabilis]|nr:CRISPR-associated protein [Isoptericola variabilis]
MTTASPTTSPTATGHVTIVFTSDWGVSTGVGQAGRTHSTIERSGDDPVVRGTVITGVLREQAMLAAKALDGPDENSPKKWTSFALWLFGQDPNSEPGSTPHPRHVLFTDATPASSIPVHDTVSLSIDPTTGTARAQFLRFTERAAAGVLTGTFTLIDEAGLPLSVQATIDAAHFLLGVAGLMVRGIGSGRSGGDGECTVVVSDKDYTKTSLQDEKAADALRRILENRDNDDSPTYSSADVETVADRLRCRAQKSLQKVPELPKDLPKESPQDIPLPSSQPSESGDTTWYETTLDIVLDSPVVSYEVPFSNEVRSLDFIRGTVLVPWLHGLLRKKYRSMDSAIVSGDLRISDALPVYKGVAGLPVPFVLENEKVPEDKLKDKKDDNEPCTLFNRHIPIDDQKSGDNTIPTRGRYVFVKSSGVPGTGWIGKPSLIGRQSTAINSQTGAAKDGQLFLVRALPAGLKLRASVVVSERLLSELRGTDATSEASPLMLDLGIAEQPAFLGSRKLTGTFGRARCTVDTTFTRVGSTPPPVEGPVTDEGAPASSSESTEVVSLWFTSDVLARSSALGPGGSVEDLELAFRRANIPVTVVQESTDQDSGDKNRKRILTAIRHRRVDSWSPRDNAPRATRLAIQAGSVVQVRISPDDLTSLKALGHIGVGELTPQGYGRFRVDSPILAKATLPLFKTKSKSFTASTEAAS